MLHLFTHIPKTGGTSFKRSVIDLNFEEQNLYKFRGIKHFLSRPPQKDSFIDGHFSYGVHIFTFQKCVYYTILRQPVDHAISFYNFVKQCDYPGYKHPLLRDAQSLSLVEFTRKHANLQTRMLAGIPWERLLSPQNRLLLAVAKRHLKKKYFCFGFLENLEEFEQRVAGEFGWSCKPIYEQSKITRVRPRVDELDKDTLSQIEEIQKLDLELYKFATSIYSANRTE